MLGVYLVLLDSKAAMGASLPLEALERSVDIEAASKWVRFLNSSQELEYVVGFARMVEATWVGM